MNSKLFNTFFDNELGLTHFEYYIIHNKNNIGEYQLTFEYNKVTLSLFKINKKYRGNGFAKKALKEINYQLSLFSNDFDFSLIELNAKSFNYSPLNNNQLILLYEKYFDMEIHSIEKDEILMKRVIH